MPKDLKLEKLLLKRRAKKITDVPTFRRIKATDSRWSREDLINLCILYANEWKKAQADYFDALERIF